LVSLPLLFLLQRVENPFQVWPFSFFPSTFNSPLFFFQHPTFVSKAKHPFANGFWPHCIPHVYPPPTGYFPFPFAFHFEPFPPQSSIYLPFFRLTNGFYGYQNPPPFEPCYFCFLESLFQTTIFCPNKRLVNCTCKPFCPSFVSTAFRTPDISLPSIP